MNGELAGEILNNLLQFSTAFCPTLGKKSSCAS